MIGKYKNAKYAQMKFAMSSLAGYGNVDLKLTGDFQSEIFVDVRNDIFVISSADSKDNDLTQKYGDNIWGLDDDKTNQLIEIVQPMLIENIANQLN